MPVYNLDISADEHFDFDVLSITSNESVYRIIHELNNDLNIELELQELLDFTHKEGEDFYFPVYGYTYEEINIDFHLLPNLTSYQPKKQPTIKQLPDLFAGEIEHTTKLLPELDKTDYFLLIKGVNRYLYNHTVLETLQQNKQFTAVHEIFLSDIKDKKSRSNLLF